MPVKNVIREYEALTGGGGLIELGSRTQIELQGNDRASFLHNLCTNDIRKLPLGAGCEAFLTNVQGKVLAHIHVWALPDSLVLETMPGLGETLLAHLDRYLIREQVELVDRSQQWTELLLAGPAALALLAQIGFSTAAEPGMIHGAAQIAGREVSVRRVALTQPCCFLLSCDIGHVSDIASVLRETGATPCGLEALEMARIEAGFPWYGQDITVENLAPEVGRDKQAISYVKGCYLGQETIARIDALGHVNRLLVGVAFEGPAVPTAGTELSADGKSVGHVTSAAFSPRLQAPLALAYVRRGHNEAGARLASALGSATVVKLPLMSEPTPQGSV